MRTIIVSCSILAALLFTFLLPATADACSPGEHPSRFELFDRADVVVVGKPTEAPKYPRAGDVTLSIDVVLKGKPGNTLTVNQPGGTCDPGFWVGTQSLVFLQGGHVIGEYKGAIRIANEPWVDRMKQWAAATDDAARAAVAADSMSAGGELSIDGVILLVNKSSLVAALTKDHIATIANAWPKLHSGLRGMLREIKHPELRTALANTERAERANRQRLKTRAK